MPIYTCMMSTFYLQNITIEVKMVQLGPPLVIEPVTFVNVIGPETTLIDKFVL